MYVTYIQICEITLLLYYVYSSSFTVNFTIHHLCDNFRHKKGYEFVCRGD